jgi:hypothetical protein
LYITLYLKYVTNFKPQSQILNYKKKHNKKIFTKNFFIIFLIYEYFSKKYENVRYSSTCLPIKVGGVSFLRAPNRSKSSQILLTLSRYVILITFKIYKLPYQSPTITTNFLVFFFKKNFASLKFFESNIFFNQYLRILIYYNYNLK